MFDLHMGLGILLPSISINDKTFLCKTLVFPKPSSTAIKSQFSRFTKTPSASVHFSSDKEKTLQFDDLRRNWNLKRILFEKLKDEDSDPVRILEGDGDWSKELFWAVVGFLNQTSRSNQVLQVFDKWLSKDNSRINKFNYERIIKFLVEEELVEDAVLSLRNFQNFQNLQASSEMYDSIIHGFIKKGQIEDALFHLKEMEDQEMKPQTSTYNHLIKAHAKNGSYDDMAKCVKRMESSGCFPDESTYNLLIREFSVAGLIKMMERMYRIMISKKMNLEASTIVAMLEVYSNFGILEKMDKIYKRVLRFRPKIYLQDDLIRKVAVVYMENCMFSKLDNMGIDLYSKKDDTKILWCLRMLAQARLLSRAGMKLVAQEMDYKKVKWNVTIVNIMLFGYVNMKDFEHLEVVLAEMEVRDVKPDIVTCGILWDSHEFGFDGLSCWRKMGFLGDFVEFNTDPLVLVAFGKGEFLNCVEELDHTKSERWTYEHIIKLIKEHQRKRTIS